MITVEKNPGHNTFARIIQRYLLIHPIQFPAIPAVAADVISIAASLFVARDGFQGMKSYNMSDLKGLH